MTVNIDRDIKASYKRQTMYQKQSAKAVSILNKVFRETVYLNLMKQARKLGFSKSSNEDEIKKVSLRRVEIPDKIIAWAVAQRIKIAREKQGLNQDELAQKTGIARPNIVRIEKGRHMPNYSTLQRIARVLNLDMDHLLAKPAISAQDMAEFTELAEFGVDEWGKQLEAEDKA